MHGIGSGPGAAPSPPAPGAGPRRLLVPGRLLRPGEAAADGEAVHRGPYAVVSLATSGFTPMRDRVVEIAVVRLDANGRLVDEWATLLDPAPGDVGPLLLHGLVVPDVAGAPRFGDVGRSLLARLEGHVVAAHRADLTQAFLAAEFRAASLLPPTFPALDTFRLAQASIPTPNHRLPTLAAHLNLAPPTGAAADDARLVTGVAAAVLGRHREAIVYPVPAPPALSGPAPPPGPARSRSHRPPAAATDPWLAELLAGLRMGAREAHDPRVALYVETVVGLLARGRIVADEVRELGGVLARSGYSAADIQGVLEHLLESIREAAFERPRLGAARLRHLRAAAASLGSPGYFDDLVPPPAPPAPPPGSGSFARPVRKPPPPPRPPARLPRCGHCLTIGHYTSMCPRRRRPGPVSPVDPVAPI